MLRALLAAAAAVVAIPAAASAQTYTFGGGSSAFSYGYGVGGSFTALPYSFATCAGASGLTYSTKFNDPSLGVNSLPTIGVNTNAAAVTVYTVTIPGNTLFLHPGSPDDLAGDAVLQFTAPKAGLYNFAGTASRIDRTSNGNGVLLNLYLNGAPITVPAQLGPAAGSSLYRNFSLDLLAGDTLRLSVNNNGDIGYDSVGLTGAITAVPEPASWALMIGGFGLVGAMRRRRSGTPALA